MKISNKSIRKYCYNNNMTFKGEKLWEAILSLYYLFFCDFFLPNNFESLRDAASN